jgi:hypothetical protein
MGGHQSNLAARTRIAFLPMAITATDRVTIWIIEVNAAFFRSEASSGHPGPEVMAVGGDSMVIL